MPAPHRLTSSLRKQGPITTGLKNGHERLPACQLLISRGMGPGSRSLRSLGRDDEDRH
ncbi:hypothetical protein SAMN05444170_4132 [Bradyrhizobium erythrophlei]|uniref:Uncharacterized protein n=1 Tax=Bradyrhizobium erythrophlei TaxID=1437360 RepID=A0A1M7UA50_9BRAD|nr:hypothetical protein SAMN05444170_4132 [Bradyrhizobium erythrophlei]